VQLEFARENSPLPLFPMRGQGPRFVWTLRIVTRPPGEEGVDGQG
jgi:hypothetical protein